MSDWKQKLPMQLTLSRMYILPFILVCLWPRELMWSIVAAGLFIIASITDYYDGYFARKYNAVSNMGKFMDPVSDKILVTSVLTAMIPLGVIDPYMVIILTIRDTLVGGLRAVAATDQVVIAAKTGGKWKTGIQMVGIPAAMLTPLPEYFDYIPKLGYWLLWVSVVLSIVSGYQYYLAYKTGHLKRKQASA
jgi:CDP-diacylglycerol--glycerol-3-phosphate 3-phosphatidyltransferase